MSRQVRFEVVFTDDLTGGEAECEAQFGWEGDWYAIDLSSANYTEFHTVLEPYLKAGRKISGPPVPPKSDRDGRMELRRQLLAFAEAGEFKVTRNPRGGVYVPASACRAFEQARGLPPGSVSWK